MFAGDERTGNFLTKQMNSTSPTTCSLRISRASISRRPSASGAGTFRGRVSAKGLTAHIVGVIPGDESKHNIFAVFRAIDVLVDVEHCTREVESFPSEAVTPSDEAREPTQQLGKASVSCVSIHALGLAAAYSPGKGERGGFRRLETSHVIQHLLAPHGYTGQKEAEHQGDLGEQTRVARCNPGRLHDINTTILTLSIAI